MDNKIVLFFLFLLLPFSFHAKEKKVVFIITDGIPADCIERLQPENISAVAKEGGYSRAYTGGEIGGYSQTSTISAIGYMNILTGTWMNKHNVRGNDGLSPNYQYWSIFRIAKEQDRDISTAVYSSWTDNRTVLLGEGRKEAGNLEIDYAFDGYDHDNVNFPPLEDDMHIYRIDSLVAEKAASCIRNEAPDLNWVYFWYTDDAFHIYGDGKYADEYIIKTDALVGKIRDSVKYREKNFGEDWLIIVTTDHGRDNTGHGHGGQTSRERTVWISSDARNLNRHFDGGSLSLTDINPTICRFMGFSLPENVMYEQDGVPFIGKEGIYDLRAGHYDDNIILGWKTYPGTRSNADIYVSFTNNYLEGKEDKWVKVGTVPSENGKFEFDTGAYPESGFYKFAVVSPESHLNVWVYR